MESRLNNYFARWQKLAAKAERLRERLKSNPPEPVQFAGWREQLTALEAQTRKARAKYIATGGIQVAEGLIPESNPEPGPISEPGLIPEPPPDGYGLTSDESPADTSPAPETIPEEQKVELTPEERERAEELRKRVTAILRNKHTCPLWY